MAMIDDDGFADFESFEPPPPFAPPPPPGEVGEQTDDAGLKDSAPAASASAASAEETPTRDESVMAFLPEGGVHLSVSDPQHYGEGRNKFTSYRVDVQPTVVEEDGEVYRKGDPIHTVRRRYSDFQWLYNRLYSERPGAVVPVIPHRHAVKESVRFSDELVWERRGQLERFLDRVRSNPELRGAPCLRIFLTADADAFESAKDGGEDISADVDQHVGTLDRSGGGAAASPGTAGRKERIKHLFVKTAVKLSIAMGDGELEDPSSPDAVAFEEIEQYVQDMDAKVQALAKQASRMMKGAEEQSTATHLFGQTLFEVGRSNQDEFDDLTSEREGEDEDTGGGAGIPSSAATMLKKVGVALSSLGSVRPDGEGADHGMGDGKPPRAKFEEEIKDLERTVQAVKTALQRRKNRQLTYTTRLQQVKNRQNALYKQRMNPPKSGADEKISHAEAELRAAEQAAKVSREELNEVSQRVLREIDRVKLYMHEQLQQIILHHARNQIEYNKRMTEEWTKLVPHLEATIPNHEKENQKPSSSEGGKRQVLMSL